MKSAKIKSLQPILDSSNGLHLTIYLKNRGDVRDLRSQLVDMVQVANASLIGQLSDEERRNFIEPLESLSKDSHMLRKIKANIGIFRKKDYFRILSIPSEVELHCHLASSFHVKPILRWLQHDREFAFVGINDQRLDIYLGNLESVRKIDSFLLPDSFRESLSLGDYSSLVKARELLWKRNESITGISEFVSEILRDSKGKLFFAGKKDLIEIFQKGLKYSNTVKAPIVEGYNEQRLSEYCYLIRANLKEESRKSLLASIMEFRNAEKQNIAKKNVFQIAKAAVQGKIKKLLIASDINIFGKVNNTTGSLIIHPQDLDHEDDDILDDLAQTVLASGGDVVVLPKKDIPSGRPILAIMRGKNRPFAEVSEAIVRDRIISPVPQGF